LCGRYQYKQLYQTNNILLPYSFSFVAYAIFTGPITKSLVFFNFFRQWEISRLQKSKVL
jgi:hypothetical protein